MSRWQAALRLVGMGWYVGGCIFLGVVAGLWLDNRLGTHYWVIIGLMLGLLVAFYGVYRMILPNINKNQKKGKS
ncbi:MAG: AtpZ/AtpI family protein [Chloroflexota bacterium]